MIALRVFVGACFLFASLVVHAQPVVTEVLLPNQKREVRTVRLDESVWVRVSSIDQLRSMATEANAPITLWVDGRDTKLTPQGFDDAANAIRFRLDRNDENDAIWKSLLHDPFTQPQQEFIVSTGAGAPLRAASGANNRLTLVKIVPLHTLGWMAALLVLILAFLWLARNTDIVRSGPQYEDGTRQPYSLGRVQMAWWFFLVLAGFVAIDLVSGDGNSITPSLLALMGISAGTALGSAALDATGATRAEVVAQIKTTEAALQATPNDPALLAELAKLKKRLTGFGSENWLYDILKDQSGAVALHRLQIVVWTIVLGVIFIARVAVELTMPEFSSTLLALMGISGGTYIGFKLPGTTQSGG